MINWIRNAVVNWLKHERPPPQTPLSDFARIAEEARGCDVLLVEGRSRVSDVIKLITQSSWSHAALFIGSLNDIEDPGQREALKRCYEGDPDAGPGYSMATDRTMSGCRNLPPGPTLQKLLLSCRRVIPRRTTG